MKLNCKPGDLAIVVRSKAGNEGKIVRCLKFVGKPPWGSADRFHSDCWRVEGSLAAIYEGTGKEAPFDGHISDSRLRPIRDGDGEDEILRIAGLPAPIKENQPA